MEKPKNPKMCEFCYTHTVNFKETTTDEKIGAKMNLFECNCGRTIHKEYYSDSDGYAHFQD